MIALLLAFASSAAEVAPPSQTQEGERSTFLVIYRPGPEWPAGTPVSALPLKAHGRYMIDLYRRGTMTMAGPLADDAGGAVVLSVADVGEARRIVAADPAVRDGLFTYELHGWRTVDWVPYLRDRP